MADVIRKSTNRFTKGLVMDFSPENTKNELLTHALNATLLTFNGNELSLQNDMGNGRVETAFLPEGYMPVGTCEYGGIIYIVSYNPLEDKSQIGCFPSPERNISSDELGIPDAKILKTAFQNFDKNGNTDASGLIKNNTQYVLLKNDNLNPGDKFIISANREIYDEKLADLWVDKDDKYYQGTSDNPETFELVKNPIIALNVVSIEDSGKIIYLNSSIRQYEVNNSYSVQGTQYSDLYKYHIYGNMAESDGVYNQKVDIDAYRNVLSSGYSVFKAKTSGKLAILAELIMIDSYSVTHSIKPKVDVLGNTIECAFDIVLHTEIEPQLNESNYYVAPKLQFYYLENSQGYIQTGNGVVDMFNNTDTTSSYNANFLNTDLSNVYTVVPDSKLSLSGRLKDVGKFNFPKSHTYHGRMKNYGGPLAGNTTSTIYTKFTEGKYHRINKSQIINSIQYFEDNLQAKFYYYDPAGKDFTQYEYTYINNAYTYYVRVEDHIYHDVQRDTKYQGETLYKMITIPIMAPSTVVEDVEIEKFQEQEIVSYVEATTSDIASGETLYEKLDDKTYASVVGIPKDGVQYYIRKSELALISIGYVVTSENTKGTIYYFPNKKDYIQATREELDKYWDFVTYPYESGPPYGCPITLYWRQENWAYKPITASEAQEYVNQKNPIYYNTNYINIEHIEEYVQSNQLFVVMPIDTFVSSSYFQPNENYNYIHGYKTPSSLYPKDDKLYLYTVANFIPDHSDEYYSGTEAKDQFHKYNDLILANIKIPEKVASNGLDLPFKYEYTIVPCMNYGKLQHLAISNTIDFSKLHAFNQSKFHTWKYRIDNDQLRLTFGADIYDTYEQHKVDGIILEFYDCWGFAGSIEISDKKSYSGIFTKIIPLNSYQAINTQGIHTNADYVRNINIQYNSKTNSYTYKDKPVTFKNYTTGWSGITVEEGSTTNDCGTLYSNMIYGVKTYLRRDVGGNKEYIRKQDFFLFTLPIYNDYYYTVSDFSNLENPELNLMLTYKLKDSSTITPYSQGEVVTNGYNANDNTNLQSYLGGFYQGTSLDLIRYYQYKGTSELFLEIGLQKDYESLNLNYNPEINSKFSCELRLIGDLVETENFTVNSGIEGLTNPVEILNYKDLLNPSINNLGFGTNAQICTVSGPTFRNSNFINSPHTGSDPIPININYNYVVGYKAKVDSIRSTQVQATTICALCHKQASGEYNYEDFGVYEQITTDAAGNEVRQLLSNAIFYNEGTETKEVFGLCKQIAVTGNMSNQLSSFAPVETDATEIKTAGKLNSGDPLKQLVGQLGKLTFCQPHAHGFSEINGVNIHEGNGTYNYGIPSEAGGGKKLDNMNSAEDTWGIAPRDFLYKNPKYNLCVNTKNSINYNSEFISSMDYKEISSTVWLFNCDNNNKDERNKWYGPTTLREFVGMTGQELAQFNTKLVQTMKGIYAYNPGYDSLSVNVGNITLQDYSPYFTSNLINQKSSLSIDETKGEFFNDYINLGPISITDYLKNLNKHSIESNLIDAISVGEIKDNKFVSVNKQVKFIPNLDYCGTEINPYLITSLTYNTPVPQDLEQELEVSASDMNVIKHADGTNTYLKGIPNKKALYGYNKDFNKMVQLDVSNYTIQNDGTLVLKNEGSKETKTGSQLCSVDDSNTLFNNLYNFKFDFSEEEQLSMSLSFGKNMVQYLQKDSHGSYLSQEFYVMNDGIKFSLVPSIYVYTTNQDFKYTAKVDSVDLEIQPVLLNDEVGYLYNQSAETLYNLVNPSYYGQITLNGQSHPKNYYVVCDNWSLSTEINGSYGESQIVSTNNGILNFNVMPMRGFNMNDYSRYVLLFVIKVNKVNFTVTKISNLETDPNTFLSTTRTSNYGEKVGRRYQVKQDYKNTQIKGTSITLNDLIYEPNQDGHRLFMRNNLWNYDSNLRGKLYYRLLDIEEGRKSWDYNNGKYLNNIFLFTGPCFTPDTLNK